MNRPSIRRFTLVFLLALAFVSPLTMGADEIPPAGRGKTPWLFVQDAAGGSLTGPDDQHLKLKLKNVRKNIQAIAAGPIPQAVALTNEEFFTAWQQMFPDGPATASLSYDTPGQQQPRNIVLTLTNPQYDAVKRTVTFDAVRIKPYAPYNNPGSKKPNLSFRSHQILVDITLSQTTILNDEDDIDWWRLCCAPVHPIF